MESIITQYPGWINIVHERMRVSNVLDQRRIVYDVLLVMNNAYHTLLCSSN